VATEYELYQLRRRIEETKSAVVDLENCAQHIEQIAVCPADAQTYLRSMVDSHRKSAHRYEETLRLLEQELRDLESTRPKA